MHPFTVHWSPVSGDAVRQHAAEGLALFAFWPSPVSDDACFREAGFTDFWDGDENWDAHAAGLLTRLLAELSTHGAPRLTSKPVAGRLPWYRRPFAKPEVPDVRQQIELPMQWGELPDCVVSFGESGVSLRAGSGHHLFWIALPERDAATFVSLVERVAGSHPVVRTDLRWECLI